MLYAEITGWGKCVPPAVLNNEDLATFIETSDEWITTRTGIKERRILHCNFSDMARVASMHALAAANLDPLEIDLILLGSLTSDSHCPNTASIIADQLGARNAAAIDINSACTGFLYGLHLGTNLIRTGAHKKILVIGGEFITHYMNWTQREVAVLFGDACGAVVIEASESETGMIAAKIGCESEGGSCSPPQSVCGSCITCATMRRLPPLGLAQRRARRRFSVCSRRCQTAPPRSSSARRPSLPPAERREASARRSRLRWS